MSDLSKSMWPDPFTPPGVRGLCAKEPHQGTQQGLQCSAGQDGCCADGQWIGVDRVCSRECAICVHFSVPGAQQCPVCPECCTASPWAPAEAAVGMEMPGEETRWAIVPEAAVNVVLELPY